MQGKTLKKRLLFVGYDVTDPNSWSGTPYAIYTEFIRQGVEVVTYNPYKWKQNRLVNILVRILHKTILPSLRVFTISLPRSCERCCERLACLTFVALISSVTFISFSRSCSII